MARILIIDDDPDTRSMLEDILKSARHQTVTAANGKEGLKQHLANPADLVITDMFMPDQDGFETIVELRKRFPTISIIGCPARPLQRTYYRLPKYWGPPRFCKSPSLPHNRSGQQTRHYKEGRDLRPDRPVSAPKFASVSLWLPIY